MSEVHRAAIRRSRPFPPIYEFERLTKKAKSKVPRRDSAFAVVILLHWFVKEILEILHSTRKKKDQKFSIFGGSSYF